MKTPQRPAIVNALARASVYLLPFLYVSAGFTAARSCDEPARVEQVELGTTDPGGAVYVEVAPRLIKRHPHTVQYLEQAADEWCKLGTDCVVAVYESGEYTPPAGARVIKVDGGEVEDDALGTYGADQILITWDPHTMTWWDPSYSYECPPFGSARYDKTLAHELGHALGVGHTCRRNAVEGDPDFCEPYEGGKPVMFPAGGGCTFGEYSVQ